MARRSAALALAVLVASPWSLVALAPVQPAAAVDTGGTVPFGVSPVPAADGSPRAYFDLHAGAGAVLHDTVVVQDRSSTTETLRVQATAGDTAPNSGDTFVGQDRPCGGTACWISGLPSTVTLAGGAQVALPFTVTVPPATAPGQYLAGISVWPAQGSPPVTVGGNANGASAQAVIVNEVDIGVAVTVGDAGQLHPALEIPDVTTGAVGSTPRLLVHLHDGGNTFVRADGTATCTVDGRPRSWPVHSDTLLPGKDATVPVNAPGLAGTNVACTVTVAYAPGATPADWSGRVDPPAVPATPTGRHRAARPAAGTPGWAVALIALGAAVLAVLVAILVLLLARRRQAAEDG